MTQRGDLHLLRFLQLPSLRRPSTFRAALVTAVALLCGIGPSHAQSTTERETRPKPSQRRLPRGFLGKTITLSNRAQRKYAVFTPPQYVKDKDHKWPLIIFLHGSAERGTDGIKQTTVGLPTYVARHAMNFPFIVVMPQAQNMWFRGQEAAAVWAILDEVQSAYRVDPDRIYLTGLSMGGIASWELSVLRPDVFAAIVPVCGFAPKDYLSNIVDLPTWAFHGALDNNVSVQGSRDAIEELKRLGGAPIYTEYPKLQHICWDEAYATPDLWRWLLKQRRKPTPRVIDYVFPAGLSRVWWLAVEGDKSYKKPCHVHAEITDGGLIEINSQGVLGWALISDAEPLKPNTAIEVKWNGQPVFKGEFTGILSIEPQQTNGTDQKSSTNPAK
ncbi:hypothetical protein B7486_16000 [cyanobacterium TDX16]|nr:hypothetical protein B7486_16000 [cyanobacterium TDX16]